MDNLYKKYIQCLLALCVSTFLTVMVLIIEIFRPLPKSMLIFGAVMLSIALTLAVFLLVYSIKHEWKD